MNTKLVRAVVATIALSAAALVPVTFLGWPGLAAVPGCQRLVWIDPQASVNEAAGTLRFTVHSEGMCLVPGAVTFTVTPGSAGPADYWLSSGALQWGDGDAGTRTLTAGIANDTLAEAAIENFWVTLTAVGPDTRVAGATGEGRILDDEYPSVTAVVDDAECQTTNTGTSTPFRVCSTQMGINILPLTVTFNRSPRAATSLVVSTADGTMVAGTHYVPVSQLVPVGGCSSACGVGPTTVTVMVALLATPPPTVTDRYFTVHLTAASAGVTIADPSARASLVS